MIHSYDLIVFDSTPGGLAAAIATARRNMRVLILTEDQHIGAMQTAGLGNTNAGQRATVGGLAAEFHHRILHYYTDHYGSNSPQAKQSSNGFHFEPHVAEAVYEAWIAEEDIHIWREVRPDAIQRDGNRILAIRLADGRTAAAPAFIDASYEGDLIALAGCTTHTGRESSSTYNESLAGIRLPLDQLGQADHCLQAYDYRLCLTNNPDNRIPFKEPANMLPEEVFEDWRQRYAQRALTALSSVIPLNHMPNQKTDSRFGEWVGASWDWPHAGPRQRAAIAAAHRHYAECLIWFVLHHPVIPGHLQDELRSWGYAADEFTDNDHWPYHIYVREARRLVGDWVMTQNDCTDRPKHPDTVALGCFFLDVHPVRIIRQGSQVIQEGLLGTNPIRPYPIPYRALLPRQAEVDNLWSCVAVSASHVAFSSIRMEPVWMMLGHAAGIAAALAAGGSAHRVDTAVLIRHLSDEGAVLNPDDFPEAKHS